jgi:hypothetical protein
VIKRSIKATFIYKKIIIKKICGSHHLWMPAVKINFNSEASHYFRKVYIYYSHISRCFDFIREENHGDIANWKPFKLASFDFSESPFVLLGVTFPNFLCLFDFKKIDNENYFLINKKFSLIFRKIFSFYFGWKILFISCEKFRNIILFADYIKFDPQTFDCYIFCLIFFLISSLKIWFLY